MKQRHILPALAIAAGAVLATSCDKLMDKAVRSMVETTISHDYTDSEKWGKVVTIDLPTTAFHEADLQGAVRLEYTQGSVYSLQVEGNEKAIEAYSISVDDEELEAFLKDGSSKVGKDTPAITLRITAPCLTEIQGSGATEVIFADSVSQAKGLDISLSGLGKLAVGTFQAPELDITITGAGQAALSDVRCTGDVKIEIEGAANIQEGRIECRKLELKAEGAANGRLDIHTAATKVKASGASHITLTGETHSIEKSLSGASTVQTDDLK